MPFCYQISFVDSSSVTRRGEASIRSDSVSKIAKMYVKQKIALESLILCICIRNCSGNSSR